MTARGRSFLALGSTLGVGVILGALLVGAIDRWRGGRTRGAAGFVRHMEDIIRPSAEQRERIRPLLEATAARNDEILGASDAAMRAELEALVDRLRSELESEQLERLERFARRPGGPPRGPGDRGPGGRGPR